MAPLHLDQQRFQPLRLLVHARQPLAQQPQHRQGRVRLLLSPQLRRVLIGAAGELEGAGGQLALQQCQHLVAAAELEQRVEHQVGHHRACPFALLRRGLERAGVLGEQPPDRVAVALPGLGREQPGQIPATAVRVELGAVQLGGSVGEQAVHEAEVEDAAPALAVERDDGLDQVLQLIGRQGAFFPGDGGDDLIDQHPVEGREQVQHQRRILIVVGRRRRRCRRGLPGQLGQRLRDVRPGRLCHPVQHVQVVANRRGIEPPGQRLGRGREPIRRHWLGLRVHDAAAVMGDLQVVQKGRHHRRAPVAVEAAEQQGPIRRIEHFPAMAPQIGDELLLGQSLHPLRAELERRCQRLEQRLARLLLRGVAGQLLPEGPHRQRLLVGLQREEERLPGGRRGQGPVLLVSVYARDTFCHRLAAGRAPLGESYRGSGPPPADRGACGDLVRELLTHKVRKELVPGSLPREVAQGGG